MAQQDAQKSEIHETTDDATSSPGNVNRAAAGGVTAGRDPDRGTGGNAPASRRDASPASNFERGAADKDIELAAETPDDTPTFPGEIGGGPGAGDSSSGGGAGAGILGGGTDMRTNGAFDGGDPEVDRRKLFPDAASQDRAGAANPGASTDAPAGSRPKGELKATHIESDDSDFG